MVKILVVDDSKFMRKLTINALKSEGYDFVEAGDGDEAIKKYVAEKPDLVLLDIVLAKGKSGLETLKEIKNIDKKARVIMVTVIDMPEVIAEAKNLGVSDYVTKPFKKGDLITAVKKVIK